MEYIMNRNLVVRTLLGHTLSFEKGVPLEIPYSAREEVMQRGGVPKDVEAAEKETAEEEERREAGEAPPPTGEERVEQIKDGIRLLQERNQRGDFTGSGLPDAKVLSGLVGFSVDAAERTAIFQMVNTEDAGE